MSYIQYFIIFLNYNYGAIFHFEFIEYCLLLYIQKVGTNYIKSVNTSLTDGIFKNKSAFKTRSLFFPGIFIQKLHIILSYAVLLGIQEA